MNSQKIAIIGAGVVGQASGRGFIDKGHVVTFYDIDPEKISDLRAKIFPAFHIDELTSHANIYDLIFISVPTPTEEGQINLQFIEDACSRTGSYIKISDKYVCVVIRSTVIPGTSESIVTRILSDVSEKEAGSAFGICMNPEYLREETAYEDFVNPRIIIWGELDQKSGDTLEMTYISFNCPIYRVSLIEAEYQKYVHNLFNAVKIAFFNEMRNTSSHLTIDIDKIFEVTSISAEGSWNPKYGIRNRGPFSGNCLPKDTEAFRAWANSQGKEVEILNAAIESNKKFKDKK